MRSYFRRCLRMHIQDAGGHADDIDALYLLSSFLRHGTYGPTSLN